MDVHFKCFNVRYINLIVMIESSSYFNSLFFFFSVDLTHTNLNKVQLCLKGISLFNNISFFSIFHSILVRYSILSRTKNEVVNLIFFFFSFLVLFSYIFIYLFVSVFIYFFLFLSKLEVHSTSLFIYFFTFFFPKF